MNMVHFVQFTVSDAYGVNIEVFSEGKGATEYVGDIRSGLDALRAGLYKATRRLRNRHWAFSCEMEDGFASQLQRFLWFLRDLPAELDQRPIVPSGAGKPTK